MINRIYSASKEAESIESLSRDLSSYGYDSEDVVANSILHSRTAITNMLLKADNKLSYLVQKKNRSAEDIKGFENTLKLIKEQIAADRSVKSLNDSDNEAANQMYDRINKRFVEKIKGGIE